MDYSVEKLYINYSFDLNIWGLIKTYGFLRSQNSFINLDFVQCFQSICYSSFTHSNMQQRILSLKTFKRRKKNQKHFTLISKWVMNETWTLPNFWLKPISMASIIASIPWHEFIKFALVNELCAKRLKKIKISSQLWK